MRYEVKDKETGLKASNINLFPKKKTIYCRQFVCNKPNGGKLIPFLVIFASNFDEDAIGDVDNVRHQRRK